MKPNYKATLNASFTGYIVQAIVNNFVPLLFVTFNTAYNIPYTKITFLITFNFLLQLGIDLASAFLLDKIGYRISAVLAHIFAAAGLISPIRNTADKEEIVKVDSLPKDFRFFTYQEQIISEKKNVPSHAIIDKYIKEHGEDYRYESHPHPIDCLKDRCCDNTSLGREA